MKFLPILAIFTIWLTVFSIVTSKITHRRLTTQTRRFKGVGSNMLQFATGLMEALTGGQMEWMQCLPDSWKAPNPETEGKVGDSMAANGGVLATVVGILEKVIQFACPFKSIIISFIQDKLKKKEKKRFFIQLKTFKGSRQLQNSFRRRFLQTHSKVKKNSLQMKGILDFFKGITDSLSSVKKFFTDFFESPTWISIKNFVVCMIKNMAGLQTAFKNVVEFITIIGKVAAGWADMVQILVGAICAFKYFKTAVNTIVGAINEPEPAAKWRKFGLFFGQLIVAIGRVNL